MKRFLVIISALLFCSPLFAQQNDNYTLLKPDRVFDGQQMHTGWWVLVKGNRIAAVGEPAAINAPASSKIIELSGKTLMPGMIEGHSHLFLHPYNETSWNDQVLFE